MKAVGSRAAVVADEHADTAFQRTHLTYTLHTLYSGSPAGRHTIGDISILQIGLMKLKPGFYVQLHSPLGDHKMQICRRSIVPEQSTMVSHGLTIVKPPPKDDHNKHICHILFLNVIL